MIHLVSVIPAGSLWKWIRSLGLPGLILLGIFDNAPFISTPAGGVDLAVALLAFHDSKWWFIYALMAIVGEVAGGYVTYLLAEKGGEKTLKQRFGKTRAAQAYKWFGSKRTGLVVAVGAMLPPPFPFTPVLIAAGVVHMPPKKFLVSLVSGRSIRFLVIAYLSRSYGGAVVRFFSRYYPLGVYLLIALVAASCIAALLYFKWYKPRFTGQGQ